MRYWRDLQLFWIEGKECNGEALIYSFFIGTCCVQYPPQSSGEWRITEPHEHKGPDDYQNEEVILLLV